MMLLFLTNDLGLLYPEVNNYFFVWHNFREDINKFLDWLHQLKDAIAP